MIGVLLVVVALAQEDCLIRAEIVDEWGSRVKEARLSVLSTDGSVVQELQTRDGVVRICDLPFGPHTLSVRGRCGASEIRSVRITSRTPQLYKIVVNTCPWLSNGSSFPPTCHVYGRIVNEVKRSLPGATVKVRGLRLTADSYGRFWQPIPIKERTLFRVESQGRRGEASISCGDSPQDLEITIVANTNPE